MYIPIQADRLYALALLRKKCSHAVVLYIFTLAFITTTGAKAAEANFSEESWLSHIRRASLAEKLSSLEQAEKEYRLALAEAIKPGADENDLCHTMRDLAAVCQKRGKTDESMLLLERCMSMIGKRYGQNSQKLDPIIDPLAMIYFQKRRLHDAEQLYAKLVEIRERVLVPEDSRILAALLSLSSVYILEGKYPQGEQLSKRMITIREKQGNPHDLAQSVKVAGDFLRAQHKEADAEQYYKRALGILLKSCPSETQDIIMLLKQLGGCEEELGNYAQAEQYFRKALSMLEKQKDHTAMDELNLVANLGNSLVSQKKYPEAEIMLKRRLKMAETLKGPDSRGVKRCLERLAGLYTRWGKPEEAKLCDARARSIDASADGKP